jgi:hypothetical protein
MGYAQVNHPLGELGCLVSLSAILGTGVGMLMTFTIYKYRKISEEIVIAKKEITATRD